MKRVTVLIRHLPLNTIRASEALRVAVGYTLAPNRVTALLFGDGVFAGAATLRPEVVGRPELAKHTQTLRALGHRVVADRPSHDALGGVPLHPEVELLDREEVLKLIEDSDVVVPF
ncbi:MAG: DsrE family protein [Candidatus Methylomirabilales bacterium]